MFRFGKTQAAQKPSEEAPIPESQGATLEDDLRAHALALREILDQTSDLVHLADNAGHLTYVNRAWQRTMGTGGGTLTTYLTPSARAAYQEACQKALETGESVPLTTTFHAASGQAIEVRGHLQRHPNSKHTATVCGLFQNITAQGFQAERVSHGATRDQLTNIANQAYFAQHLPLALARAKRQKTLVGVVYIDIDDFRDINEQFGYAGGDRVLIAISDRLTRCVRTEDLLARIEGDHFVLALERLHTAADATFVVERILSTITTPLLLPTDEEVRPEASIGIALSDDPGADVRALLRAAEGAMRRAKGERGAAFAFAEEQATGTGSA